METKQCYKCKEEKPLTDFRQYKSGVNKGCYHSYCRLCRNKNYKEYKKRLVKNNPWLRSLFPARSRCSDKNSNYYKRGIKCFLSKEDIKYLWYRDNAKVLKRPSVDRIDTKGNYTLENCRFIELSENSRLGRILPKGKVVINGNNLLAPKE